MAKKSIRTSAAPIETPDSPPQIRQKPLVFISHDSRDADLAEAFGNLLIDVSGGTLKSFRSSDKKGTSGIEFGSEWYSTVMSRLDEATDVVALLTQRSIERPWILYEAGVAKGKLNTTVLGLATGVPLSDVNTGPFGQFQNCADDQDSLTKLVVQLLKRNPDADPREEAVKHQVSNFIAQKDKILSTLKAPQNKKVDVEDGHIAKLFEEIKVMLRDVNQGPRISNVTYQQERMFKKIPPGFIEDMLMDAVKFSNGENPAILMIIASILREDTPWLYEPVMELYRATTRGVPEEIEFAYEQFINVTKIVSRGPFEKYLFRMNEPGMFAGRELMRAIEMISMEYGRRKPSPRRRSKPSELSK